MASQDPFEVREQLEEFLADAIGASSEEVDVVTFYRMPDTVALGLKWGPDDQMTLRIRAELDDDGAPVLRVTYREEALAGTGHPLEVVDGGQGD